MYISYHTEDMYSAYLVLGISQGYIYMCSLILYIDVVELWKMIVFFHYSTSTSIN